MLLETNRLILRDWNEKDIDDLVEGLNNIEVSKWLVRIPYPYTFEDAKGYIDFCVKLSAQTKNRNAYEFAIELKSEKKVIGGTALNKINVFQGTAGGGIWLNKNYHGNDFGIETFNKRLEFAFNELNLRRIENGFLDGNTASLKMQERLGYRIEGKRRKGFLCVADGEYKDEILTGLLKEEWKPIT